MLVSYQDPKTDVKFSVFDKQRLFDILLNHKNISFHYGLGLLVFFSTFFRLSILFWSVLENCWVGTNFYSRGVLQN